MTWSVNNKASKKSLNGGLWSALFITTTMTASVRGMMNSRHATWKGSPGT